MRLWEMTDEWRAIMRGVEDANGELTPELEARLTAIDEPLRVKIGNIIRIIRDFETDKVKIGTEMERLLRLNSVAVNGARRLRSYLQGCMSLANITSMKTDVGQASLVSGGRESVEYLGDPADLTTELTRVNCEPDKEKALAMHKEGKTLPPGWHVKGPGTVLRIH